MSKEEDRVGEGILPSHDDFHRRAAPPLNLASVDRENSAPSYTKTDSRPGAVPGDWTSLDKEPADDRHLRALPMLIYIYIHNSLAYIYIYMYINICGYR